MNKVLDSIQSGARVSVVSGDRCVGKTTSITQAVKSMPNHSFLIMVYSKKQLLDVKRELSGHKNFWIVTKDAINNSLSLAGCYPDIIIIDDFIELFKFLEGDTSKLNMILNRVKKPTTQLVKVG